MANKELNPSVFLDLPYLTDATDGRVNNIDIYGLVLGEVNTPYSLRKLQQETDGVLVAMRVVGCYRNGAYYVQGDIVTFVHRSVLQQALAKPTGFLAVKLTGGVIKIDKDNLMTYLKMYKTQQNQWALAPVRSEKMVKDVGYNAFLNVLMTGAKNDWVFSYPVLPPNGYQLASDGYLLSFTNLRTPIGANVLNETLPKEAVQLPPHQTTIDNFIQNKTIGDVGENLGQAPTISQVEQLSGKAKLESKNRATLAEKPPVMKTVEIIRQQVKYKVDAKIKELPSVYDEGGEKRSDLVDMSLVLKRTALALSRSWKKRQGNITGNMLFREGLIKVLGEEYSESQIKHEIDEKGVMLLDLWDGSISLTKRDKTPLLESMIENNVPIYFAMLEHLYGIRSGKLTNVYYEAEAEHLDFYGVIKTNPYMLSLIDPELTVDDLDKIARTYKVDIESAEIRKYRDIALLHNLLLEGLSGYESDTVIEYNVLKKMLPKGTVINKALFRQIQETGSYLPPMKLESIQAFLEPELEIERFKVDVRDYKPTSGNKYIKFETMDNEERIKNYVDSGIGIEMEFDGKKYITDYIFLEKEMYIYEKLYRMASQPKKEVDKELVEQLINDFEKMKDKEFELEEGTFKLEQRQREAVGLVDNPVMAITGPAGSGKTTTAEAVLYATKHIYNLTDDDIRFVAPTGKAANRLREVVKRPTSTIHSLYKVGGNSKRLMDEAKMDNVEGFRVLIMDESSMPNVNLVYEMMLKTPDNLMIFFLGDIEQLPPIGFGTPYANLLRFLPCVALNVNKRASDGSGITKNAEDIIYNPDKVRSQDLQEYHDFKILDTRDVNQAVELIYDVCTVHLKGQRNRYQYNVIDSLGKLHPDDIQIITPINGREWGVTALNNKLQPLFNPHVQGERYVQSSVQKYGTEEREVTSYYINDRVLHNSENNKKAVRFIEESKGVFRVDENTGIMRGDMGKVHSILRGNELTFLEDDEEKLESLNRKYRDVKDSVYVICKFTDIDVVTNEEYEYLIFYPVSEISQEGDKINVYGKALDMITLAYAATVHKLQGSQAKLVIVVLLNIGPVDFMKRFISRNMIYTAITRGKGGCYMIGSIKGADSVVNIGVGYEQTSARNTLTDVIVDAKIIK